MAKVTTQPRSLRSKVTTELENLGGPKLTAPRPANASGTAEAHSKGGIKRNLDPGRRGQGAKSAALVCKAYDSSSCDCIKETIQLYQLEKRKEASGDPPQNPRRGRSSPTLPAHSRSHATKSALLKPTGKH